MGNYSEEPSSHFSGDIRSASHTNRKVEYIK